MTWQALCTLAWPQKLPAETPKRYLTRIDHWSCQKLAEVRKGLRAKQDKSPLRRRWNGFELIVEKAS